MATTRSTRNNSVRSNATAERVRVESPQEITRDVTEYVTEYARQNPGYAALACIGVGFIPGWKLKPW